MFPLVTKPVQLAPRATCPICHDSGKVNVKDGSGEGGVYGSTREVDCPRCKNSPINPINSINPNSPAGLMTK